MKKIKSLFIVFSMVLSILGCSGNATATMEKKFTDIAIGDSRQCVVSIIGNPDNQEFTNLLGITYETTKWKSSGKIFEIHFVNNRVISKRIKTVD